MVVCTSNVAQEGYWQERLEATRGQAAKAGAIIIAVHEDWGADGAGNGQGPQPGAYSRSTFQLNISTFRGIGGAFTGYLGVVEGVNRVYMGCISCQK